MAKYGDATNTRTALMPYLQKHCHKMHTPGLSDYCWTQACLHEVFTEGSPSWVHLLTHTCFFCAVQQHSWESSYLSLANSRALKASHCMSKAVWSKILTAVSDIVENAPPSAITISRFLRHDPSICTLRMLKIIFATHLPGIPNRFRWHTTPPRMEGEIYCARMRAKRFPLARTCM